MQGLSTPLSTRRFRRRGGLVASLLLLATTVLVAAPLSVGATSAEPGPLPALGAGEPTFRYIVTAESSMDRASLVGSLTDAGVTIREEFTEVLDGVAVSLSAEQYLALRNDPRVDAISRDTVVSLESTLVPDPDSSAKDGDIIPGRYIVQTKPTLALGAKATILDIIGDGLTATYSRAISGYAARLSTQQVQALERHPAVVLVEPDRVIRAVNTQSNPTWGLDRIDQRDLPLDAQFRYLGGGAGVKAYVIDSGIASHADFGTRLLPGFRAAGLRNTNDQNGHGTHVAGTIGGATWGVAKQVSLVPVRVLDASGSGTTSGVVSGIDWVINDHAAGERAVANLSLGGGASPTMDAAVARLVADGVVTVVAAGNSDTDACGSSPAREPSAVTVGATTSSDDRAWFSNYGNCLDLFAPGVNITSTWLSGSTNTISGTSMAAPHVAGAVASYWSRTSQASKTSAQIAGDIVDLVSSGKVTNAGTGSPNKMLYLPPVEGDVPGPPTGVTAQLVTRGIEVSWVAPSISGADPIVSYSVSATTGDAGCTWQSGPLTCVVRGIAPGAYQFRVRATNSMGTSELSDPSSQVEFTGTDDNNYFAGRQALNPAGESIDDSNLLADREPGEPSVNLSGTFRTLWYSFVPTVDGSLTIDLAGSTFDTVLGIYTGSSVASLSKIGENDDEDFSAGRLTSKLTVQVERDVAYQVQVGSFADAGGSVRLSASFSARVAPEPPSNVVGVPGDARILASWTPPVVRPELVSRYVVTASPGGKQCEALVPNTSCVVTGLVNGVPYRVSVASVNSVGTSASVQSQDTMTPSDGPTGPRTARTWALDRIDQRAGSLDSRYAPPADGKGVRIYVVDTGILATHQEFVGHVVAGVSTVEGETTTEDCHGHGTHVSSSAAGSTFGVANQATIVPVRVLDCLGQGYSSWVIAGLEWIVADMASRRVPAVVNMSLGGWADTEMDRAVESVVTAGAVVVVAAGNEMKNACDYSPARVASAVTVAASTVENSGASFTNTGSCVDTYAPGSKIVGAGIFSDMSEDTMSGTSMAAPHVAGYAAVVRGLFPTLSASDVVRVVTSTATVNALSGVAVGASNRLLYVATARCAVADIVDVNCTTGAKNVTEPVVTSPPTTAPAATVPVASSTTTVPVVQTPAVAPSVVAFATGRARTVQVPRPASRTAASAPRVTVAQDAPVIIRVPAMPKRSQPTVSVKSRHGSVALGKLRVDRRGTLRMPKLSFTKTGVYTFSFKVGKRTFFTKVSVTRPARASALSQRSVTVAR